MQHILLQITLILELNRHNLINSQGRSHQKLIGELFEVKSKVSIGH